MALWGAGFCAALPRVMERGGGMRVLARLCSAQCSCSLAQKAAMGYGPQGFWTLVKQLKLL